MLYFNLHSPQVKCVIWGIHDLLLSRLMGSNADTEQCYPLPDPTSYAYYRQREAFYEQSASYEFSVYLSHNRSQANV